MIAKCDRNGVDRPRCDIDQPFEDALVLRLWGGNERRDLITFSGAGLLDHTVSPDFLQLICRVTE